MENKIQILGIKKLKRDYKVITSEEDYRFTEDTILRYMIFKDKEFTKAEFKKILSEQVQDQAVLKAISYLKYGPRSEWEIKTYIKDFNASWPKVRKKLIDLAYIDDKRYANNIYDYYLRAKKGPQFIQRKLEEKKVAREIIEKELSNYTDNLQDEVLLSLIEKEKRLIHNKPILKQKQVLTRKLLQNGFNLSNINKLINKIEFIDQSDEELEKDYNKLLKKLSDKEISLFDKNSRIINALLSKGYSYDKINKLLRMEDLSK